MCRKKGIGEEWEKRWKQSENEARSLCHGVAFLRSVRLRRNNTSTNAHPNRNQTSPNPPRGQVHLRSQTPGPIASGLENPNHNPDPKPEGREGKLQWIQLQQAPSVAAHRLWQNNLHRFRHHRTPEPGHPLPLTADICHGERPISVQLRDNGDRAFELHVRRADAASRRRRFVQWRGPGVSERGAGVVAQAAAEGEPSEEFLGEHECRGEGEECAIRGGAGGGVCDSLPGVEALALLQGLRLQLGHPRAEGVREWRGAPEMVEGSRRHEEGFAEIMWVDETASRWVEVGEEEGEELGFVWWTLENQYHRSQTIYPSPHPLDK